MREKFNRLIVPFVNLAFSRTARNTYTVFVGNVLSAFFSFLFTILLFRNLSLSDFGYFSALMSFLLLTTDLADLGIGSSLSSFLPPMELTKERLLSFLHTAFNLQLFIILAVGLPIFIFSDNLSRLLFHSKDYTLLLRITDIGIITTITVNFAINALTARQKFQKAAVIGVLSGALRLLFLLTLIYFTAVNLQNTVLMQTLAQGILLIAAFWFLKIKFLKVKTEKRDMKILFNFAIFLGIARGLTAIASRLDVLMLISLKNATEAGIYSTAAKVISIYPLLAGSFSAVLAPRIAHIGSHGELSLFLKKAILATAGLMLTTLVMIIIAYPFITVLFGQKAAPAVEVFRWLLVSMIFFVASIPPVTLSIYYLKKPHILTVNSILQLLIVFIGNLYFIPRYSRLGASFSLILAYGITFFLTSFMALYYYRKAQ